MESYDVVIIGSGPAGLTAAIYTSRADLKTLVVAGLAWGGQLMLTSEVENFPGFPEAILGPELMTRMRKQAAKFGTIILDDNLKSADFSRRPFEIQADGTKVQAQTVIIATGAAFKWLGLPNEQRLIGRGVSSCATCDAAFFRNKEVAVVGGGDAAMEEALVLAKYANKIWLIHRRDSFKASKIMQDRVQTEKKIKILWNTEVTDVVGENAVEAIITRNVINGETAKLPVGGLFVAIGHVPATELFKGKLELDTKGFVRRIKRREDEEKNDQGEVIGYKYNNMTSIPGVFVAGDVLDHQYRQAITAAGYGCQAALEAEKWLAEISH